MTTPSTFSPRHYQWIIWTLLCLSPIIGMAVDLIAPSLPAMALQLHASPSVTKNSIVSYLLGYALGNFASGFLSDAYGRKILLRLSLLGFVLASIVPIFLPTINMVLFARMSQGLMLGSCAVIARAIYSDIIPREKLIHLGTILGTLWGLGPVIGPIIGGYLQVYFGWQACFYFFAIVTGILFLMVCLIVPETHFERQALHISVIKKNMLEVLSHKSFMAAVLLMGLVYSLIITFNTAGPFLIQSTLKHSPVYFGHVALWLGVMFLLATFVCRFLIKSFTVDSIYRIASWGFFSVTVVLLALSYRWPHSMTLIGIASGVMFFMCGIIFPMSIGKGMALFRAIAGTATATMYLINTLITSVMAFLMSFINLHSAIALLWLYFSLVCLCLVVYWTMVRVKKAVVLASC